MDDQELTETIVTAFLDDMPIQIEALRSLVETGQAEQAGKTGDMIELKMIKNRIFIFKWELFLKDRV